MSGARLAARIEAKAGELTARVVGEMYRDPFWIERFGERGRHHTEQDGKFHLSYLAEALTTEDAGIMDRYARWLRSVLVSRGMCTRHLAENFERLERAIADEVADAEPAVRLLQGAREALRYEGGPARELQDRAPELARKVSREVMRRHPDWRPEVAGRPTMIAESSIVDVLTYLADAHAADRVELFRRHVAWSAASHAQRIAPASQLEETLAEIGSAVAHDEAASAALKRVVRDALGAATTATMPTTHGGRA